MLTRRAYKKDNNDNVLGHFILIGIFLFEAIREVVNLIITTLRSTQLHGKNTSDSEKDLLAVVTENTRCSLASKSKRELIGANKSFSESLV